MFGKFVEFMKTVGHLLAKTFSIIKKLVPEDQLAKAIELVRLAATRFVDNADRREWVVHELMTLLHLPESVARFLTELALQHVKADAIDAAAGKLEEAAGS